MTETEMRLSLIYTKAFTNPMDWSQEDHLKGLAAVFAAGADAQRRKEEQK